MEKHSRQGKWQAQRPRAIACRLFLKDSKAIVAGAKGTNSKKFGRELPAARPTESYMGIVWTPADYTMWDGSWETN